MNVRAAPGVKLYTVAQVAVIMNLSESKIWQLVRSGELDSIKIGWSRRVVAASVDAYIKKLAAGGRGMSAELAFPGPEDILHDAGSIVTRLREAREWVQQSSVPEAEQAIKSAQVRIGVNTPGYACKNNSRYTRRHEGKQQASSSPPDSQAPGVHRVTVAAP